MKQVLSALVAFVAINASATTYVTITNGTCPGELALNECSVTYAVRPASPAVAGSEIELVPVGEAGYAPAPKVTGGWLLKALQSKNYNAAKAAAAKAQYERQVEEAMRAGQ